MTLLILTGASGAGKTAIAEGVRDRHGDKVEVFFFDSIGVPPAEEMAADWQEVTTRQWIERLAAHDTAKPILFEGSTRISFIAEALRETGLAARIVLVDCDDATRTARLHGPRGQPELATADMHDWARYLREQAKEFGCEIWDTSKCSLDDSVAHIARQLLIPQGQPKLKPPRMSV